MGIFKHLFGSEVIERIMEIDKILASFEFPENWHWHREVLKKLERLDRRLLNYVKILEKTQRKELIGTELYSRLSFLNERLKRLLIKMEQELDEVRKFPTPGIEQQVREARRVNEFIHQIHYILVEEMSSYRYNEMQQLTSRAGQKEGNLDFESGSVEQPRIDFSNITDRQAFIILFQIVFKNKTLYAHLMNLKRYALLVGKGMGKKGYKVDLGLLEQAALIHDLGKVSDPQIRQIFAIRETTNFLPVSDAIKKYLPHASAGFVNKIGGSLRHYLELNEKRAKEVGSKDPVKELNLRDVYDSHVFLGMDALKGLIKNRKLLEVAMAHHSYAPGYTNFYIESLILHVADMYESSIYRLPRPPVNQKIIVNHGDTIGFIRAELKRNEEKMSPEVKQIYDKNGIWQKYMDIIDVLDDLHKKGLV